MSNVKTIFLSGGLGNQLFQASFGLYIKNTLNYKILFEKSLLTRAGRFQIRNYELEDFLYFNEVCDSYVNYLRMISPWKNIRKDLYFIEKTLNDYHLDSINNKTKFIIGYFQNSNYVTEIWPDIKKRIKKLLIPQDIIYPYIAIHVRLGDYRTNKITNEFHGTLQLKYYLEALNYLKNILDTNLIYVISDEPDVAQQLFYEISKNNEIIFLRNSNHFVDLSILAGASGVVMSNSSFSWWGAYIAEQERSAKIVAPKNWFNNPKVENPKFLIKSNWHILEN